jgi:ubiquinone/menaquinone biosynthesis C-methylase UbiE
MAKMDRFEGFLVDKFKTRLNSRLYRYIVNYLDTHSQQSCLEIGCGKGEMAYRLANRIMPVEYVATDYDRDQLLRAREYFSHKNNGNGNNLSCNVQFRTADALKLPFPNYSFDTVFSFSVLHHTENHFWLYHNIPRALAEINRVLKPHGMFVYEEYVHHEKIQDRLSKMGFKTLYRQKLWFFGQLVIATKTAK